MIQNTPLSELDKLMSGAVAERVAVAASEITQNILDPNTKPDAERCITIKLKVKPTKNRGNATVVTEVTTKLMPKMPLETYVAIGVDENGEMVMVEQTNVLPGQIDMEGEVAMPNVAKFPIAKNN